MGHERGKDDHKHLGEQEWPYRFSSVEQLIADFLADVGALRGNSHDPAIFSIVLAPIVGFKPPSVVKDKLELKSRPRSLQNQRRYLK